MSCRIENYFSEIVYLENNAGRTFLSLQSKVTADSQRTLAPAECPATLKLPKQHLLHICCR